MRFSVQLLTLAILVSFVAIVTGCKPTQSDDRCFDRLWRVAHSIQMYSDDNDDSYPDAKGWMDTMSKFDSSLEPMLHDPELKEKDDYGYAYRDKASKVKSKSIPKPEEFELVFDSTLTGRSAHGELNTLPSPGRHNGGNNIGYLDGHVKHIEKE